MKDVYLLSGLGADKRVYEFLDLSEYNPQHVHWIAPKAAETLEDYAARLRQQVTSPSPTLIGVSFGGMMAIEIAKQMDVDKVILISSAKTRFDIPGHGSVFRPLKLHRYIPSHTLKNPPWFMYWLFGVATAEEKKLLRDILRDTDEMFFRWALDHIVNWKNESKLDNIVHIHGTSDRVLPYTYADHRIENGGHLMILNRAKEIEAIIKATLQTASAPALSRQ